MAEYIAIHKCRLCAKIIEGCHTGKCIASKEIFNVACTGRSELVQGPWLVESHVCDDGSMGITDFQGFKKVGD